MFVKFVMILFGWNENDFIGSMEAATGFEPMNSDFADRCLTTWPRRRPMEGILDGTGRRVNEKPGREGRAVGSDGAGDGI